jgi:hypothetical protein
MHLSRFLIVRGDLAILGLYRTWWALIVFWRLREPQPS